jgi:HSP20 family protein
MANLQVFRPVRDLFKLSDELDRFMWGFNRRGLEEEETGTSWYPAVDVAEDENALKIHAELPGLKKDDVKISVKDGVLTLRGERKFEEEKKKDNYYRIERSYGLFARSFSLPTTVDASKIQASMKDGVLELTIPKKPEAKEREIAVEVH